MFRLIVKSVVFALPRSKNLFAVGRNRTREPFTVIPLSYCWVKHRFLSRLAVSGEVHKVRIELPFISKTLSHLKFPRVALSYRSTPYTYHKFGRIRRRRVGVLSLLDVPLLPEICAELNFVGEFFFIISGTWRIALRCQSAHISLRLVW